MAVVTGNLKDIGGVAMANRNGVVKFTLNRGNMTASGGGLRPDNTQTVTPSSDGTFSTNLEATSGMLLDGWYDVRVEWLDSVGNLITYMEFQIKVPSGGGVLSDLIELGLNGRGNPFIWWVSLTAPPSKGYLWLHTNPSDNEDPANTGDVRQWR